jgi:hypothetical protein
MTRTSDEPTVVLVHGAVAESSSSHGVVDLLLEDDLPVLAVGDPLRGVRADEAAGAAASRSDGRVDLERMGVVA